MLLNVSDFKGDKFVMFMDILFLLDCGFFGNGFWFCGGVFLLFFVELVKCCWDFCFIGSGIWKGLLNSVCLEFWIFCFGRLVFMEFDLEKLSWVLVLDI